MVLKEAVSVSEDVMRDIQTLYSLQEVSTPLYIKAMMVLKEAVSVSEDVMRDIQTLYSLQEVRSLFPCLALLKSTN